MYGSWNELEAEREGCGLLRSRVKFRLSVVRLCQSDLERTVHPLSHAPWEFGPLREPDSQAFPSGGSLNHSVSQPVTLSIHLAS